MALKDLESNLENINKLLEGGRARLEVEKHQLEEQSGLELAKQKSWCDKLDEELHALEAEVELLFSEKMAKDIPTGKTTQLIP